jgi:hypothetical protein
MDDGRWSGPVDYVQWVERLRRFVLDLQQRSPAEQRKDFAVEIAPPLDEEELEELAESLDCGLPPPLRRFLGTAAASVSFRYACPYYETEDMFCPADQLAEWREECIAAAPSFESDFPLDRAFWRHALPLIHYPDGDGVALWVHDPDHAQPAVIYLKHADESFLLSRTFDEFLMQWEKLGYVGANDLQDYRNPKTGFLDCTTPKAVELRARLGLVSRGTG